MSDFDIHSATRPELMAQADTLGLDYSNRASKGDLQKLVADALGIAFEVESDDPKPAKAEAKPAKVWLMINKSKDDKHPVPIGVNGVIHLVERGEWVYIDTAYVEVLANAITKVVNPESKDIDEVQSYPYQISLTKPSKNTYNF